MTYFKMQKDYKNQRNFVDNEKLYKVFSDWKEKLETNPQTRMPEYIGKCILTIANGFAHYYKFRGYSDAWKENMIGAAIYNCVKYGKNFDHKKYKNPHSYLTQICYMAFINTIPREQAENAVKWRMLLDISGEIDDEDFQQYINQPFLDDVQEKLEKFEESLDAKKSKQQKMLQDIKHKYVPRHKENILGI